MSKFLKIIVNLILICAIVVAAGLLIPPFAGVKTAVIDDVDLETNLSKGSATYAIEKKTDELKKGDRILVCTNGYYVYKISQKDGENITLEDVSDAGKNAPEKLGNKAWKVMLSVPFIGYVPMALRSTEGLIIVGLGVVFVIILFILAEIWKKDEEEDELEEEDEPEEETMSRKDRKRAKKEAKKAKKEEKRKAEKAGKAEEAAEADQEQAMDLQPEEVIPESEEEILPVPGGSTKELPGVEELAAVTLEPSEETTAAEDLFARTESAFAADIASMMESFGAEEDQKEEEPVIVEEAVVLEEPEEEEKTLAIPSYTKEELLEKARAAGDEPEVKEDRNSGVTLLDYSDIL